MIEIMHLERLSRHKLVNIGYCSVAVNRTNRFRKSVGIKLIALYRLRFNSILVAFFYLLYYRSCYRCAVVCYLSSFQNKVLTGILLIEVLYLYILIAHYTARLTLRVYQRIVKQYTLARVGSIGCTLNIMRCNRPYNLAGVLINMFYGNSAVVPFLYL